MKKFKEHWHNLVDRGRYGDRFEDWFNVFIFFGAGFILLWALAKGLGVT